MKKNMGRQLRAMALAGVLSMALLGCGGKTPAQEAEQQEVDQQEPEDFTAENDRPQSLEAENDSKADLENEQEKETDHADGDENPTGDITEVGEGRFVILKAQQETDEDGGMVMAAAAPDSMENAEGFDSLTVLYDEDTHFYKRTIRDGGASYEDEESSADALKEGATVEVKGSYEGEVFHASEVQIVEVIF